MISDQVKANIDSLNELRLLIQQVDDQQYAAIIIEGSSPIGSHCRHILDHYRALQLSDDSGLIDYNERRRACDIERSRSQALLEIETCCDYLGSVESDHEIHVRTEAHQDQQTVVELNSSLERELCFVATHSVHHVAYIDLLCRVIGLKLDKQSGIAPATASFLRQAGAH
jgi:hypothetical protein